MSVLVVGMSHRSAPVSLLERLSMDTQAQDQAQEQLVECPALSEAMIVSTCNRVEVYANTAAFHNGVQDVINVLSQVSGVHEDQLRKHLYVRYADAATEHLMLVTSGLDSMVQGEQQIVGQIRSAYQHSSELGTIGPALHALAQTAMHVSKRVHSETQVDHTGASMVSLALDTALQEAVVQEAAQSPTYVGKTALVLGAGAMASLAAAELGRRGVAKLIIANRTRERADRVVEHSLAAGVPAEAVDFEDRFRAMLRSDVVVSAIGTDSLIVPAADVPRERPLILVDLSMPRDIEEAVGSLPGMTLVNIDRLQQAVGSAGLKDDEQEKALSIVREELTQFSSSQRVREVAPAVAALRKHAGVIAGTELTRLKKRAPGMSEKDFSEVEHAVHRVVDKLLHQPTVRAKELAAQSQSVSYETVLLDLFGLDVTEGRPVSVTADQLPVLDEVLEESQTGEEPSCSQ